MAGGAAVKNLMSFEEAWPILQEEAVKKLTNSFELEGLPSNHQIFSSEDYMRLYTVVYNVSHPNKLSPEVNKLYDQYKKTFEDYISSTILPCLRGKENESLLVELLRGWKNHKIMTYWLSRFFNHLSRYYIPFMKLPSLEETSYTAFCDLVFGEIKDQVRDAVLSLIDREREGEKIDEALVREVLEMFEKIGENGHKDCAEDIEEGIVDETARFYSRKALDWIVTMSYNDYMLKAEECLELEKRRISDYLWFKSKHKILEVVQHELISVHASQIQEKKAAFDAVA